MSASTKSILMFLAVFGIAAVFWYGPLFLKSDKRNEGPQIGCKDCNLIMISLSNVGAQRMSLYGYERLTTPNLDQWAKDAIVFEKAFTQTSWTLPVATSLFTSLYPYSHKVMDRYRDNVLSKKIQTLPELLRDQGYRTAAFVGGLDYSRQFGHMRGFQEVGEIADFITAATLTGFKPNFDKASEWISKNSKEKFFLFVHGYDAHCPFDPPEKFKGTFSTPRGKSITVDNTLCLRGFENSETGTYEAYYYRIPVPGQRGMVNKVMLSQDDIRYLEDLHDEEILSVDELVGNFLGTVDKKILEKTIVVVFSDHGEMFAKHGRFGRAGGVRGTLYDDVVRVPLIMKIPSDRGAVLPGLVEMIDVMPTLLDLLSLPQPKQTQGKSLVPLMEGAKEEIRGGVFAGSTFGLEEGRNAWFFYPWQSRNESVRTQEWKLIHEIIFTREGQTEEETYELYNLKDDPDELRNLALQQPVALAELQKLLRAWKDAAQKYDAQNVSRPGLLPPEIIEQAKQHGYW